MNVCLYPVMYLDRHVFTPLRLCALGPLSRYSPFTDKFAHLAEFI
jgi:hypothetical protein